MYTQRRIGLFGGSYNPPHTAHVEVSKILLAEEALGLESLWWLVSAQNPLKSPEALAPFSHRMAMSQLATKDSEAITVTDFEEKHQLTYTAKVLKKLCAEYPETPFVWCMGADNWETFHLWKDWQQILNLMPVVVLARPGYKKGPAAEVTAYMAKSGIPMLKSLQNEGEEVLDRGVLVLENKEFDVSATKVRTQQDLNLVPDTVAEYIRDHHLYNIKS